MKPWNRKTPRVFGRPAWTPPWKKRKTPVTLIVGIVCKDGIVLAADSQTTKGNAKHLGTNKINVIEFENGKALIAESGSCALSAKAIEIVTVKAKTIKIENEETIAKAIESAVREVRASLSSLHIGPVNPMDLQDYFGCLENYFELMVAYYFNERPYLCKFNPVWCIPVFIQAKQHYETSGIASELANYILEEHTVPKMDTELASVIAIKVIEDAIEYVEGCGKPTRVAVIQPSIDVPDILSQLGREYNPRSLVHAYAHHMSEAVTIFPQEKVERIAKIITQVEAKTKANQNKKIHLELRRETKTTIEQLMKELYPKGKLRTYRGMKYRPRTMGLATPIVLPSQNPEEKK